MKKIVRISYINPGHDGNTFTFNSLLFEKDWIKFKHNNGGSVIYIKADQVLGMIIEEVKDDATSTNDSRSQ